MIRIFGSDNCKDCLDLIKFLKMNNCKFEYIDAMSNNKKIEKFCDDNNVSELPHLQVIKNGKVVKELVGLDVFKIINECRKK